MWIDRRGLSKETFRSQCTINFIRAHLDILLTFLPCLLSGIIPGFLRPLEQIHGAHHIGSHEDLRVGDAAVHVGLCRKVDDVVGIIVRDELCDELFITDITVNKDVSWVILQIFQVFQVTGIGESIKVDDFDVSVAVEHIVYECSSDEASATGY